MSTAVPLVNDTADTVRRLAAVTAHIAELTGEADRLKKKLREHLAPGTYAVDGVDALRISPQRRFDPALAEQTLPEQLLALCTVTKVDSATAKRKLPPDVYASLMTESGEPRVTLL